MVVERAEGHAQPGRVACWCWRERRKISETTKEAQVRNEVAFFAVA